MITENQGLNMLARANPFPDLEAVDVDKATAYLAAIDLRSNEMTETIERTKTSQTTPTRPRLGLVGGLAAALIVGAIGVAWVSTNGDAAGSPSAEDLAVAEAIVEARGSFDAATAVALLSPEADFDDVLTEDPSEWGNLMRLDEATGHRSGRRCPFA